MPILTLVKGYIQTPKQLLHEPVSMFMLTGLCEDWLTTGAPGGRQRNSSVWFQMEFHGRCPPQTGAASG